MTYAEQYLSQPENMIRISDDIGYTWTCYDPQGDNGQGLQWSSHVHDITCLWVWHDCGQILGEDTIMPGARFGWRPGGVRAHTLVQIDPLTITASVYWPDCCGKHGFITNGAWIAA